MPREMRLIVKAGLGSSLCNGHALHEKVPRPIHPAGGDVAVWRNAVGLREDSHEMVGVHPQQPRRLGEGETLDKPIVE